MADAPSRVPRFPLVVRLTHWLGGALLLIMIMSGLQIFNAHPALYLGEDINPAGVAVGELPRSVTLGGWLAGGRRIHFAAALLLLANGLLYMGHTLATGRWRAIWPSGEDWRRLGPTLREHLRYPPVLHGAGGAYNPLQRLAYAVVVLGLLPLLIATGLALSPAWDTILPFWTDMFGGRQAARTWHFLAMVALVGFTLMHVVLVALSGWPSLRRMITGRPLPAGAPDEP
jgi:thiosulfate reductase cytochrome b subunit